MNKSRVYFQEGGWWIKAPDRLIAVGKFASVSELLRCSDWWWTSIYG